jgi:D-alanyl-D-alanine carboxypeptidase (penicillin-binding protein 5/6)
VDITAPIDTTDTITLPPRTEPVVPGPVAATTSEPAAGPEAVAAVGGATKVPRHDHRKKRRWWLVVTIVVVVALVLAAAAWAGARRINHPLAAPTIQLGVPTAVTVAGASPILPWPAKGQGAVAVPALGYTAQSGLESSVPIASLTKMTNAVVVLRDHPVAAGTTGPSITITAADVAEYDNELHNDQSTVPIRNGEVLTELQMLEAMLTQSANDIAYSLAIWDAGSIPAFVVKMNALAASLGATSTHYVDASGYDPGSQSTASDVLRVAAAGMADPTFAQVVGMSSITFPGVGTLPNVVSEIGSNGVIGIKSGYTSEAGGCLVLAADKVVANHSVLVLEAVLGQPTPPPIVPPTTTTTAPKPPPTTTTTTTAPLAPGAAPAPPTTTTPPPPPTTVPRPTPTTTTIPLNDLQVPDPLKYTRPVAEALLRATMAGVVSVPVATAGASVGTATAQWGGRPHRVAVVAAQSASLLGWPGQQVTATTTLHPVPAGGPRGSRAGEARFTLGSQSESVPLKLAATVPEPSWWWRLVHG